ncbi:MAG: GNAT family N-acetyltransferase [Acidimicrobiales bacterium]
MSAPSADVIRWGRERARTGRWRGESDVALLTPVPDAPPPTPEFLHRCLDTLAAKGYSRVVTGALSPLEQAGFLAAGFDVEERLHLLRLDLHRPLPPLPPGLRVRRADRRWRAAALAVDAAAFPPFWRFDAGGLRDALRATPAVRFRVAVGADGSAAGYAICGRSASRGFVQRLAVVPVLQRSGTGRRLLLDGLHWLQRRGASRAVVNTQVGNEAALALYLQIGFEQEPAGLSVLSTGLA